MNANLKEIEDDSEESFVNTDMKIDQLKKEYTLKNKYYPIIEKLLPEKEKEIIRHIARYRDKNIRILSNPYPLDYPIWGMSESEIIFKSLGIDDKLLLEDILKVKLPPDVPIKKNFTPFPTIMLLIMKYYVETMQEDKLNMFFYYMGYSMYWSIFSKYFKTYKPREETMTYTVNNLSNKFMLKKLGSVDNLIFYSISNTIEAYRHRIKRASDAELYYIIDALKTRLNNYFNKIKNEYEKNDKEKNVIFKSEEFDSDDNIRENSSISGDVEGLANEYTNKFFSSSPSQSIINKASKMNSISASELNTTLNILSDSRRINEVKKFYSSLFYIYLNDEGGTIDSVKSIRFLGIMEKVYRKSNTNDKNVVNVKELMNEWLNEGSKTYRASKREATLNGFRKAIYYYFIFLVVLNK